LRLLIRGEQVAGGVGELAVENPASEETLAEVALPSDEQVDAAVAAAREAARGWAATPAIERGELLHELAARLRARSDEVASVMTLEGGKPLIETTTTPRWAGTSPAA
jgi:acyl-CoA reductase-like NAD-dependent aldehyde dehydrogenase